MTPNPTKGMNTIPFGAKVQARWLIENLYAVGGCTKKEYEEALQHLKELT